MNSNKDKFKRVKTNKWTKKEIQTKIMNNKPKKTENSIKSKNSMEEKRWMNKNQKLKMGKNK